MLIVQTYIGPSEIKGAGHGLFAKAPIAARAIVWKRHPLSFFVVSRQDAAMLPEAAYAFLRIYATLREVGWELAWDNGRFINHSNDPNTAFDHSGSLIAVRDIKATEEITEDYRFLGEIEPLPEGLPEMFTAQRLGDHQS